MSASWNKQELLDIAKLFLEDVTGSLDSYTSEKGVITMGENSVSLETPSHIQYAKYGRGPGKQPPFQEVLDWVKREGIQFEDSTEEGTAWAIAKSIALNGTLNYVPNAPNALEEALRKHWENYQVELSGRIKLQVKDEVNKTYNKIDYSKIVSQ